MLAVPEDIISEELQTIKESARLEVRVSTLFKRRMRLGLSKRKLGLFSEIEDIFDHLMTCDECWVYVYDPETKR